MNRALRSAQQLVSYHDGKNFIETRYALPGPTTDPFGLGSLSLGYSHGSLKVYWTKLVGQEGCIDWNLNDFINKIRRAMGTGTITPEIADMLQGISNQLMPGLDFNALGSHIFVRPHMEHTSIGFAVICSRVILLQNLEIIPNIKNLLSNFSSKFPFLTIINRSVTEDIHIGHVTAGLLMIQKTDGTFYSELSLKFLFHPPWKSQVQSALDGHLGRNNPSKKGREDMSREEEQEKTPEFSDDDVDMEDDFGDEQNQTQTGDNTKYNKYSTYVKNPFSWLFYKSKVSTDLKNPLLSESKLKYLPLSLVGLAVGLGGINRISRIANIQTVVGAKL